MIHMQLLLVLLFFINLNNELESANRATVRYTSGIKKENHHYESPYADASSTDSVFRFRYNDDGDLIILRFPKDNNIDVLRKKDNITKEKKYARSGR
jgi:hypothetical protein